MRCKLLNPASDFTCKTHPYHVLTPAVRTSYSSTINFAVPPAEREYLKIKYLDGKDADLEGFDLIIVALGVEPREILSRVF